MLGSFLAAVTKYSDISDLRVLESYSPGHVPYSKEVNTVLQESDAISQIVFVVRKQRETNASVLVTILL